MKRGFSITFLRNGLIKVRRNDRWFGKTFHTKVEADAYLSDLLSAPTARFMNGIAK